MKNILKRVCTGFLTLATVITTLPATTAHAAEKQYWTESAERVGIIEQVMNDGSIKTTFNEGYMKVEGETGNTGTINSDYARWRALGNAIAVPCAEHIMAGIAEVLKESEY